MSLIYPQIMNLDKKEVYHEDDSNNPQYFNVKGLPEILGYGKYWFTISFNDPEGLPLIKNDSEIIFEIKDEAGTVIYSDVADLDDVDGAAVCWFWIKEDPLRTYKEITDGMGTLTIMSVLDGNEIPRKFKNDFNLRLNYPIEIRKNITNNHPILFQEDPKVRIQEIIKTDIDTGSLEFNRSFVAIETSNLQTYGGKVEVAEVLYKNQRIADSKYQQLGTFKLETPVEMLIGHFDSGSFGEPAGNFTETTFDVIRKNWHMPYQAKFFISSSHDTANINIASGKFDQGVPDPALHNAIAFKPQLTFPDTGPGSPPVRRLPRARYISKIKTKEQENDFILEYTPSGSGLVKVYSIPEHLTGSAFTTSSYGNLTSSAAWQFQNDFDNKYQIYGKTFTLYDPSSSLSEGTELDGRQTWEGSPYRIKQNLSLDKDRYFVIELIASSKGTSGVNGDKFPQFLIRDISFKLKPQKGINPYYYTSKLELPTTRRYQNLDFQVRFLNPNNEYSQYIHSGSVDVVTEATKSFIGAPTIIERKDNVLTGDLLIGTSQKDGEVFGKLGYNVYKDVSTPSSSNKGFGYVTLTRDDQVDGFGDKIVLNESGSRSVIIVSGSSQISASNSVENSPFFEPEVGLILYHSGSGGETRTALSPGHIRVDGDISASGDIVTDGDVIARSYQVVNTIVSQSVIFSSGSTVFGDSNDDIQNFRGSLKLGSPHLDTGHVFTIYRAKGNLKASHLSIVGAAAPPTLENPGDDDDSGDIYIGTQSPLGNGTPGNLYLGWFTASAEASSTDEVATTGAAYGKIVMGTDISSSAYLTIEGDVSASGNIQTKGTLTGTNLSGTNTGDQDLSDYALKTAISGSWQAQNLVSSSADGIISGTSNVYVAGDVDVDGDVYVKGVNLFFGNNASDFTYGFNNLGKVYGFTITNNETSTTTSAPVLHISGTHASPRIGIGTQVTFGGASGGKAHIPKALTVEGSISASRGIILGDLNANAVSMSNGIISASSFIGSGAGLTGITATVNASAISGSSTILSSSLAERVTTNETKLDGIEDNADVTDTSNVTSAGALMDSELAEINTVKLLTKSGISGSSTTLSSSIASTRALLNSDVSFSGISGSTINITGTGSFDSIASVGYIAVGSPVDRPYTPLAGLHLSGSTAAAAGIRQSRNGAKIWTQEIDSSGRLQWGFRSSEGGSKTTTVTFDDSTNYVGIGTAAPGEQLEVVGNISASGYVYADRVFLDGNDTLRYSTANSGLYVAGGIQTTNNSTFGNTDDDTHTFTGAITANGNISGSATSTGSFGHFIVDGTGEASLFVSGAITANGNISSSYTSTGSFGRLEVTADTVAIGGETINKTLVTNIKRRFSNVIETPQNNAANVETAIVSNAVSSSGATIYHIHTFPDGDVQPSVKNGTLFKTANTSNTVYEGFADGVPGQHVMVIIDDNNSDFEDGTNFNLFRSLDWTSALQNDTMQFICVDGTKWTQLGYRGDNT